MKVRLVLKLEKELVEQSMAYSERKGKSFSEIIEDYLKVLIQDSEHERLSPKLKKIVGAVKLPADFDVEYEKRSYLEGKLL
ncbi:DUF6364 family protein [Cytophagales bacterium LB-30]|uniref:DUF6364 family protein n=1 Tax=Shiella aurantiaca TaxID=3058365 RepID=A0ABT8F2J4_9BACT|nr:DUF6364 family protein [Shiella aurantiaca]MDN4164271.1 DUF6364 family protein [Shiella aurantiaca]